ncbi:MAG: aminoacyl-tRNA hydrolase [Desulfomonile tiedjei]|uniref:Peptidyl-tRNA hydrolase n=1 Tax=Desulfomonile tiedjei TaxID=2358 RepID=A0A9D6V566_9BACT|nr:aminoacyl-tRNA hydrolase [Desulfomonile tiedjei]
MLLKLTWRTNPGSLWTQIEKGVEIMQDPEDLTAIGFCAHKKTCTRKREQLEGALSASEKHIVVVGLGNPGSAYSRHRHNLGFMVVDELARQTHGSWKKDLKNSEICRVEMEGKLVTLVKPQTFMNLSGKAVAPLMARLHSDPTNLVVVHDDMDIAFGRVRIKLGGGAGGHKGVRSIMDSLRFSDFVRVRMGVGRPPAHVPPEEFVLNAFDQEEKPNVSDLVQGGCLAVRFIAAHGVARAQNLLHSEKDESGSKALVS